MSQESLFAPDTASVAPKQPTTAPKKHKELAPVLPGGVNLDLLDTRIYGMQRPVNMTACNHIFDDMTEEEEAAWRLKNLPFSCVYTEEDFTPLAQVKLLRRRLWSYRDIARDFPHLADVALAAAVAEGHAVA